MNDFVVLISRSSRLSLAMIRNGTCDGVFAAVHPHMPRNTNHVRHWLWDDFYDTLACNASCVCRKRMPCLKLCFDEPRAPRAVGQRQQQQEKLNMAHTIAHVTTSACLTCSYSGKKACNHADFNMIAGFLRSVTNQSEAASSNRLV